LSCEKKIERGFSLVERIKTDLIILIGSIMKKHIETLLGHFAEDRDQYRGAVVPPIFQNSLFTHPDWEHIDAAFDDRVDNLIYSRGHNPTVRMVEQKLAAITGGERALLFPSGMAAISAVVMHCLSQGGHVLTIKNIYGPANNLLNSYLPGKMGIEVTQVSGETVEEFEEAIRPNTQLIYLESPSSAVFSLQDIEAVAELAKKHGIKTAIDNSWASPVFQRPLDMGIDFEIHSVSKYIGGHSDLVGGCIIGSEVRYQGYFCKRIRIAWCQNGSAGSLVGDEEFAYFTHSYASAPGKCHGSG
jgi:cystathionine beta-lyase/cystathionine gamma-synthase